MGIHSWGCYLPRFCMARSTIVDQLSWFQPALKALAKGQRSLGFWDEDAITFGVAAGARALANKSVQQLVFASTTAPFLDRSNVGLMAEALNLSASVQTQEVSGSQRAATSALMALLESNRSALLVAADRRAAKMGSREELTFGDAGVAFRIEPENGPVNYLGGVSYQSDMVTHYRAQGQNTDYVLEERWFRDEGVLKLVPETIHRVCEQVSIVASDINQLVAPFPQSFNRKLCQKLGLKETSLVANLYDNIGNTGVGHPLLMLTHALESAQKNDVICLVGFGQGCDALLFKVAGETKTAQGGPGVMHQHARQCSLDSYLMLPRFSGVVELDEGHRAEADKKTSMAAYYRKRDVVNGMMGSQCNQCGTPHFPRVRICVDCGAVDDMKPYPFADKACHVKTFTEDFLAAYPAPPMCYGNVAFEGGGNGFLEITDSLPGELEIGQRLYGHFRVKTTDPLRHFKRYFWKPSPVSVIHE